MNGALRLFLNGRESGLRADRDNLKSYLLQKVSNDRDYHAVADASMDIREIDAQLKVIEDVKKFLEDDARETKKDET